MVSVNVFWSRPQSLLRQRRLARHLGVRRRRLHEPGQPLRRPARLDGRPGGKRDGLHRHAGARHRGRGHRRGGAEVAQRRDGLGQRDDAHLPEEPRRLDHHPRRERARCASAAWPSTRSSTGSSTRRTRWTREIDEASYQTTSVYGFGHPLYYDNVINTLRGEARARDRRPRGPEVAGAADRDVPVGARRQAHQPAAGVLSPVSMATTIHPSAIVDDGRAARRRTAASGTSCTSAPARASARAARSARTSSSATTCASATTCKIQNNVSVYDAVTLEDDVFCGPSMVFTNVYNPRAAVSAQGRVPAHAGASAAPRWAPTAPSSAARPSAAMPSSAPARWSTATCPTSR